MSWKRERQLADMDPKVRIEIVCQRCRLTYYKVPAEIITADNGRKYVDEIERDLRCATRTCGGRVRIALEWSHKMEGWVGGMP